MNQTLREALFMLVLFFANTVQAITGFAGTVLAMPFSILLIGAADAKVVLNIMALVSCLWIALRSRANVNMRELARMTGFMAVGMAAGCVLYAACPADPLQKAYGAVIVAIAVKNLIHPATGALPEWAKIAVLLAAGVMHGMFVSGGALLVVYAAMTLRGKDEFRATVSAVWVVLNSVMLVTQVMQGQVTSHCLALTGAALPALVAAVALGNVLQRRLDQRRFLTLSYALLLISGASIVI